MVHDMDTQTSSRFQAYDADVNAPCRYHLLNRKEPPNSSLISTPQPGGKGRWQLEGDKSGLVGMSRMMLRASTMYNNILTYDLIQGIVILSLIFHFIHYIGFQPRLSVIPGGNNIALRHIYIYIL
jgi:hypothetical protein